VNEQFNEMLENAKRAKLEIRRRIWERLEREGVARPPGASGRIPNFVGAEEAADRLASLEPWRAAQTIMANPDTAQLPVRAKALTQGKLLYMAVPGLTNPLPFLRLDPTRLGVSSWQAASSKGALAIAPKVAVSEMDPIDLVISGNVAVNREGARIGKGAGFSDIEVAMLVDAGLIGESTKFATTVHHLQVIDEPLPETDHDFRLDVIVTPDEVIWCSSPRRPSGLIMDHLDEEKVAAVPALAAFIGNRNDANAPH